MNYNTYLCGSWAELVLQLLPLNPTFWSTLLPPSLSMCSRGITLTLDQAHLKRINKPKHVQTAGNWNQIYINCVYIHPSRGVEQIQPPVPDSIPTAIFLWSPACPLASERAVRRKRTPPETHRGGGWHAHVDQATWLYELQPFNSLIHLYKRFHKQNVMNDWHRPNIIVCANRSRTNRLWTIMIVQLCIHNGSLFFWDMSNFNE